MRAELMGAQDQIAFKRQLLFSFCYCSCSSLAPLFACFLVYSVSPPGLDKYSFYLFPFSDEDPPPISLSEVFRAFLFLCFPSIYLSIYHWSYLSCFLLLCLSLLLPLCFPFLILSSQITSPLSFSFSAQHPLHLYVSLVGRHLPSAYSFCFSSSSLHLSLYS